MKTRVNCGIVFNVELEDVQRVLDFLESELDANVIFVKKSVAKLWIMENEEW